MNAQSDITVKLKRENANYEAICGANANVYFTTPTTTTTTTSDDCDRIEVKGFFWGAKCVELCGDLSKGRQG